MAVHLGRACNSCTAASSTDLFPDRIPGSSLPKLQATSTVKRAITKQQYDYRRGHLSALIILSKYSRLIIYIYLNIILHRTIKNLLQIQMIKILHFCGAKFRERNGQKTSQLSVTYTKVA
jgi:hypothetical protein